jgi:uncharacterized protein YceK
MILRNLLLFWSLSLLANGCTSIDRHTDPPSDFPRLEVSVNYVPHHQMRDICSKYIPAFASPEACMEWDFSKKTCTIWLSKDFPPHPSVVEHEKLHCKGYDHIGDSTLRDAWTTYKKLQNQ